MAEAVASGRAVRHDGRYVAVAQAGAEHVATLVLDTGGAELGLPERRTLERGAVVTALVMLLARTVAETEDRLGGELLGDLLDARPEALPALRERARRRHASLDPPLAIAVATIEGLERFAAGPGAVAGRRRPGRARPATTSAGWCCWCPRPTRSPSAASWPTPWPGPAAGRRSA